MNPEAIMEMLRLGNAASPYEVCGILIGAETAFPLVVPVPNRAAEHGHDPCTTSILVSKEGLDEVRLAAVEYSAKTGISLNGLLSTTEMIVWHTHPSGLIGPSKDDLHARIAGACYMAVTLPDGPAVRY